jgi:hypothetical protein
MRSSGHAASGAPLTSVVRPMPPDSAAPVAIATGPVRAFQGLVVMSAFLGIVLWLSPYFRAAMAPEVADLLSADGADAISYEIAFGIRKYMPAVYLVAGLGLFFFTWWGRWLFVACYVVGIFVTIIGGFTVMPALETTILLIVTLIDGAILGLAFLSPLSRHFGRVPV